MNRQITYLISGQAHLPYLVVSLWTLRNHYSGPIQVHAWPESFELVSRIAEDKRLGITAHEREPKLRRKDGVGGNSQFLDKIDMTMGLDANVSLYLDADTTINGNLENLFLAAEGYGFCSTQWNDWVTTGPTISKRVGELRSVEGIPNELVELTTQSLWPSVNGGVWAARPSSPVLPLWYEWTKLCGGMFIADEKVLHLMQSKFFAEGELITLRGAFNVSPKHKPQWMYDNQVVIWHYHGDSNVRPAKSQKGVDLWMPIFDECRRLDVGGIDAWWPTVGNRHLIQMGVGT